MHLKDNRGSELQYSLPIIYSEKTPSYTSEVDSEDFWENSKNKRKFAKVISIEGYGAQAKNKNFLEQSELNWDLDSLGITFSDLRGSSDNADPIAWDTQHQNPEPEGPPVLGLFGPPEIKEQVKEKDPFLENLENSPQNHEVLISSCNPVEKSSKPKNKDISKKTKKLENTDSPTYEREHLTSCFSEFINIKKGENDFFAVNNRIKTAEEVTVFGLGSFLRGFKKYADSISPTKNYGKSNKKQNSKFQKYSNNQELFQKIYDKPFRRFLSHDEKPFDESFLNELRKAIEIKENDGFKTSIKHFILVLEYMMKKNGEDFIFIKNSQLKDLFANLPSYFFQLGKEDHVNEYVEHQHQADDASEIIKVLDLLDWKSIFTADPNAKDSEKMKFILKTRTIPIWAGRYTIKTFSNQNQ
ncbi:hypothetical protein BY996DRAFT_6415670 [Phakopsora pachyrhizi]|nr:hypothetical protein BY996DRAFT_6415670 [Phakopsora pachyrhizi]